MKGKVFIDTNVLIDVLIERPSSKASRDIFYAVRCGKIEGVITTQSIIDASYILRKKGQQYLDAYYEKACQFFNYFNEEQLTSFDMLYASRHMSGDFEDDVQFARAVDCCCDAIITNDKKFRKKHEGEDRHIKFFTPEEFVAKLTGQTSGQ